MFRYSRIATNRLFSALFLTLATAIFLQIAFLVAVPALKYNTGSGSSGLDLGKLPLSFEANAGQVPEQLEVVGGGQGVHYIARTTGATFYFAPSEVMLTISEQPSQVKSGTPSGASAQKRTAEPPELMRLRFVGASAKARIDRGQQLPGTVSYYRGNNPSRWLAGLPTYSGVTYRDLYPGIDLQYNGTASRLKGTYTVAPGADPAQIRWQYETGSAECGAGNMECNVRVSVDASGNLQISTDSQLTEAAPVAWQVIGGERLAVEAGYILAGDGSVGFALGAYDPTQPLVIDPTLTYSSYLGNAYSDESLDIAVDGAGNIYVTGSNQTNPYILGDLAVTKINADASAILYSVYLVGSDSDVGYGIAVDGAGNAYVAGESYSTDFPLVNPFQTTNCNATLASDAVVVKLNPSGSAILYSTYLGGCGGETGRGIAVDSAGSAYVTGESGSTDFPLQNPFQNSRRGPKDVFVTKFAPSGQSLVYSTYLGGEAENDIAEYGWDIDVDGTGSAYVTGYTGETDFPLHNPIQAGNRGFGDSYLTKFSPSGTSLTYSTYLGGAGNDIANDVVVDSAGNAYVAGWTDSTNFPTVDAYQSVNGGYEDIYVTKVNPAGSAWLYSTYLGGIGRDGQYNLNLGVTTDGSMIVSGDTASSDFPVGNWIQQFHANPTYPDIFVTGIAPSGAELLYSTFLGGNVPDSFVGYPIDVAYGMDLDASGNAYITGQTNSPNWPIVGNPFQPKYAGGAYDGLVAKVDPDPQGPPIPRAPTPSTCSTDDYVITQSTGAEIVPGTDDTGNHCDFIGCTTGINLPFPVRLYDRTFTSAYLGSGGTIGFVGNQGYAIGRCLPLGDPQNLNFGIMGYWDYIETDGACEDGPCGIYTSVSGSAPNLMFNIEWRARRFRSFQNYDPVNFEIRLHENSTDFEVIYGAVSQGGSPATFGVQRDIGSQYTQYACGTGGVSPGFKLSYTLPCNPNQSPTPTSTATNIPPSSTATRTGTATPTQPPAPTSTHTSVPVASPSTTPTPTQFVTATASPTCGPTWARVSSPDPNPGLSSLYDVEVLAPDDIWAVGKYTDGFGADRGLTLRWNGTAWSEAPRPDVQFSVLTSISAIAPNDIWAVGFYNPDQFSVFQPLTAHWNGSSWTVVPSPANSEAETTLQGVGATSTNDVWAVGENEDGPMIMHWNGSAWSVVSHGVRGSRAKGKAQGSIGDGAPDLYWDSLYAVEVVSANDVWAVGALGDNSLAMHWNGTAWSMVNTPNPYSTVILRGVHALSASDIWAVGSTDFYMGNPKAVTLHWDGQTWANVQAPAGNLVLYGVGAMPGGDLWTVGYERIDDFHTGAAILQRVSGQWVHLPGPNPVSPTLDELYDVAASGPNDAWAVGTFDGETLIDRYYNSCPTPAPTGTPGATSTPITSPTANTTPTSCTLEFTDVPPGSTFYSYVRCMVCHGIISGYSSGCESGNPCFRPASDVTRGQLAKIVANAANFTDPAGSQLYQDLPVGSTFYDYVQRLASREIVGGYACGGPGEPCVAPNNLPYFRPNASATRGQISKIVAIAAGWTEPTSAQTFEDVPPGSTFHLWIEDLASHEVMHGYECGNMPLEPCMAPGNRPYFRPANNATRGQVSKVVANTFYPECSENGER